MHLCNEDIEIQIIPQVCFEPDEGIQILSFGDCDFINDETFS